MNPDEIVYKKEDGQIIEQDSNYKIIIPHQEGLQINPYIMFGEEIIILIRNEKQIIEIQDSSLINRENIMHLNKILIEEYKNMNEAPNQYYAEIKFKD